LKLNDTGREVYRALRESQSKYSYFLLAASGAAIGFAVSQTGAAVLAWSQSPLGLAVVAWGHSFFCGCRHLQYVSSNLYANLELFRVQAGEHSMLGEHPEKIEAGSVGIRLAMESNSERGSVFARWQFRFLVSGAILYLVWHVTGMYLRSPGGS